MTTAAQAEALAFLTDLGRRLLDQHTYATSEPIYQVIKHTEAMIEPRVTAHCFTEAAAQAIIEREQLHANTHSLYVDSGHKNPEWRELRHVAMALANDDAGAREQALSYLCLLGHDMREQDNRATSEPVFVVVNYRNRVAAESDLRDGETITERQVITPCLTQKGADQYIERERHNLGKPEVFVDSGWQNPEWTQLRRIAMAVAEEQQAA